MMVSGYIDIGTYITYTTGQFFEGNIILYVHNYFGYFVFTHEYFNRKYDLDDSCGRQLIIILVTVYPRLFENQNCHANLSLRMRMMYFRVKLVFFCK